VNLTSLLILPEAKREIKKLLEDQKLKIEWDQYLRCNGLPNASDPSDLRKYIHMWVEDFKNVSTKEINWLLKVNEQSILTQDQTVPDLSKANLRKLQPDVGEMYAKRASEVLGILDEMDAILRDQYALSPSKLKDLLDVSFVHAILCSFRFYFYVSLLLFFSFISP
jgi:cancer susceptibility candidate protein 1